MAVTTDILRSYRAPGAVVGRLVAQGPREDRALVTLALACVLLFVAQLPALRRAAHLDDSIPFDARVGGALTATLFFLPLLSYGIAALSHLLLRALGKPSTWHGTRTALFWALLAVSPLVLLQGALEGVLGHGWPLTVLGLIVFAAFAAIWIGGLRAVSRQAAAPV